MSEVIDAEWSRVESVRVGRVPAAVGVPDGYVTVAEDDRPVLRVDVYAYGPSIYYGQPYPRPYPYAAAYPYWRGPHVAYYGGRRIWGGGPRWGWGGRWGGHGRRW